MPDSSPVLFTLRGPWRRVIYVTLYELIAIAVVTGALLVFTREGVASATGLAVGSSLIAVGWNLCFNWLFEQWERRQAVRGRSVLRRVAHAIGFEGGLLLFLVPFFAWWLKVSLWQALLMDVGLLVFFLVYTFIFTWTFDRLFGLPASAR
ncbi:MAG: PACE efflux transporter [Pseudomonadota bacterium]|nr:PACE efflux transporter [Pseudomonadota bacterium]